MSRVVSFSMVQPAPRYDDSAWTQVRIEESASKDGPWVALEIKAIPVDPHPEEPSPISVTTEHATLDSGWYQLVFLDETGDDTLPITPMFNGPTVGSAYMPEVSDVGALLRARTKDTNGNEIGTFVWGTRPNFSQATALIQQAAREVVAPFGYDVPVAATEFARAAIALRAAMLIELSYYPEQVGTDRSPYSRYEALFATASTSLMSAIDRERAEIENPDEDPSGPGMPRFWFPPRRTLGPETVM